ncbi:MAG: ISL3 family transposase [Candidatus Methanoplasma sp.]|jgi:transposase|nr:ISL3 family transposase [Candidatus Methanoplasma sp.]
MSFKEDDFRAVLRLGEEWKVLSAETDHASETVVVRVGSDRGQRFPCPGCGKACPAHDFIEREWRSLDVGAYRCVVRARLPRTDCPECGVRQVVPGWAREYSRYSIPFERRCMGLVADMPVASVARHMGVSDDALWLIAKHYVDAAMGGVDMSCVTNVGVDETSSKRGHDYITIFVDMDTRRTLFATEGKDSSAVERFADFLEAHGGDRNKVASVSSDMSAAFICGVRESLPKAAITFDRFHVMKLANDAVDEVRKEESAKTADLADARYLLARNRRDLSEGQKARVRLLFKDNVRIMAAYGVKEALATMYRLSCKDAARVHMYTWLGMSESCTGPIKRLAETVRAHLEGIVQWHDSKVTNAVLEGLNSVIQAVRRMARGYRRAESMITILYLRSAGIRV